MGMNVHDCGGICSDEPLYAEAAAAVGVDPKTKTLLTAQWCTNPKFAHALGDIVMVELPEVGDMLTTGEPLGAVESPKSVSDVFSPVTGEVVAVNEELEDAPEQVNDSPFSEGWLVRVRLEKPEEIAGLMNAGAYTSFFEAEDH